DVRASQEQWRDTLVSVVAEVARTYADLRGTQRRLGITQHNIVIQQDSLHLAEVRAQAGLGNQLDVERQREQLEQTRALLPTFTDEIDRDIHALSVMLAQQPSALHSELESEAPLPSTPPQVPVGLPSDLLKRRPDVRAAQAQLDAALERVGAAKADLFPKIFLTGIAGRQATSFSGFALGGGNFFSVGPSITIPILESGRIRGNIQAKREQYEQAVTRYQAAALGAFRDTEDSLSAYGREQDRRERLHAAVAHSKQATELATELYTRGLSDFLSVLEAQRDQLTAEDALVASDTAVVANLISLYKALGGGWEPEGPAR
ncbi:MAG: TolC family protein, partial [Deltaproteobacteria bacterium]|nr:TolC family protein [Deltaproteobacteria bacterium]